MKKMTMFTVTVRMDTQHKQWLDALSFDEGHTITSWIRRHIKVAAQPPCAPWRLTTQPTASTYQGSDCDCDCKWEGSSPSPGKGAPTQRTCIACDNACVMVREVGAYGDNNFKCIACGKVWWVDADDG